MSGLWSNREMPGCVSANIEGGHIPIYSCCILLLLSSEKLHSFTLEFHIAFLASPDALEVIVVTESLTYSALALT